MFTGPRKLVFKPTMAIIIKMNLKKIKRGVISTTCQNNYFLFIRYKRLNYFAS